MHIRRMPFRGTLTVAATLAALWIALPVKAGEQDKPLPEGQTRVVLPVEGMTCGGCVAAIKIAVKKLDGIVAVDGDHEKGTATVTYEESKTTAKQIVEKINTAGFKASLPRDDRKPKRDGA